MKQDEQFALDWHRIVDGWIKTAQTEMDAAYRADDQRRYRFAAMLAGEMQTAQRVMLGSLHLGRSAVETAVVPAPADLSFHARSDQGS